MRVEQEKVRLFHEKFGFETPDRPQAVPADLVSFRESLILEELAEYRDAATRGDLVEIADALADLLYVVLGTSVVHGIELQPIFDEVHRSNMTKEVMDPITRKGGKGPTFERPRIAELLLLQTTGMEA